MNVSSSVASYLLYMTPLPTQHYFDFTERADREGGRPLDMSIETLDINGYTADQGWSDGKFMAPSVYYAYTKPDPPNVSASSPDAKVRLTSHIAEIL